MNYIFKRIEKKQIKIAESIECYNMYLKELERTCLGLLKEKYLDLEFNNTELGAAYKIIKIEGDYNQFVDGGLMYDSKISIGFTMRCVILNTKNLTSYQKLKREEYIDGKRPIYRQPDIPLWDNKRYNIHAKSIIKSKGTLNLEGIPNLN